MTFEINGFNPDNLEDWRLTGVSASCSAEVRNSESLEGGLRAPTKAGRPYPDHRLPAATESNEEEEVIEADYRVLDHQGAESSKDEDQPLPPRIPAYQVLGWDSDGKQVHFRSGATGLIWKAKPSATPTFFLGLDPDRTYWSEAYKPVGKSRAAFDSTAAYADLIAQANTAGVFQPSTLRGRGVYWDQGRTIWHLGDRLEVDGMLCPIIDVESAFTYELRPALGIDPLVQPSTDEDGRLLIDISKRTGWAGPADHLYVAGFAVISNVAAAIPCRPGLQVTSRFSSGKSDQKNNFIKPLQAGSGLDLSAPTMAGVRQLLGCDTVPICIDESEAENPQLRKNHLMLVRQSFDGTPTALGSGNGAGTTYPCRSSVALFCINGPLVNAADASRMVTVRRRQIPQEEWVQLEQERQKLVTPELGNRIMRRTVSNLHALLHNIEVFTEAVRAKVGDTQSSRFAQTHGTLLAGAYSLIGTQPIEVDRATAWLEEQQWSWDPDDDEAPSALQESYDCLDHLLGTRPARGGGFTLAQLVGRVRNAHEPRQADEDLLGANGLKVDRDQGLLVANSSPGIKAVYKGTKWRDGGHKERLRDLPEVTNPKDPVHFPGAGSKRCSIIPWSTPGLDLDPPETDAESASSADTSPPEAPA